MEHEERLRAGLADRYRIDREIGVGGMATVYLAADLRHNRQVAVKVLDPELAQTLGAARFLREIETVANLSHAHILPLFDSGEAGGFLFYVMPFVEGGSLRDRLERERQIPLEDALCVTREVADALGHAHDLGIVHRDIKPENILFHAGHAFVADFGVARAVTSAGGENLTRSGMFIGTPTYMSPEQAGGGADLDARSDLYSLGCVLYEMLAGEPPYTGPNPGAVIAKKIAQPTPSVSVIRDTVPPAVEAAITKALSKSPADRFSSAADFAEALSDERLSAARPPQGARRRSRLSVAATAVVTVLVVGLGSWWLSRALSPAAPSIEWLVVMPPEYAEGDPAEEFAVAGMHRGLISQFRLIPGLEVISRESARAAWAGERTIPEIATELDVDAVVTSQVVRTGDSVRINVQLIEAFPRERQRWDGEYAEGAQNELALYGRVALGIADHLRASITPENRGRLEAPRSVDPEAYRAYLRGEYQLYQLDGIEQAAAHFRDAIQREPSWAPPYAGLAMVYVLLGSWWGDLPADEAAEEAGQALARAFELDESLAEAYLALGGVKYYLEWDWAGADSAFTRGLELGAESSFARLLYMNFLLVLGRADEAIALGQEALAADPLYPAVHNELAGALQAAGRYDEALQRFQAGLRYDPDFYQSHYLLLQLHLELGNVDLAVAEIDRLPDRNEFAPAAALALAGRTDEAREIMDVLVRRGEAGRFRGGGVERAIIHVALGETDEAIDLLRQAFQMHDPALVWINDYFLFDPIRSDPRFQDLMRAMDFLD